MHPRTESTIEELRKVQWFSNVGAHDTDVVKILSSWKEAVQSCGSPEWEDLCQEAVNQYCQRLVERSPKEFSKWNERVIGIKPIVKDLVREKTKSFIALNGLPKVFLDTVDWDIIHLCMEAEFADVYPPGFFASQGYWYMKGHFPCGWDGGPFPRGKLVIF